MALPVLNATGTTDSWADAGVINQRLNNKTRNALELKALFKGLSQL